MYHHSKNCRQTLRFQQSVIDSLMMDQELAIAIVIAVIIFYILSVILLFYLLFHDIIAANRSVQSARSNSIQNQNVSNPVIEETAV